MKKKGEIPKWCWVYGFKVVTDERPDVKHRPIIFKAPMVRAIMEGRKTQTRRPLKPAPTLRDRVWSWSANRCGEGATWDNSITRGLERMLRRWSPFGQVGDRLWVRETWGDGSTFYPHSKVLYRADEQEDLGATCRQEAETDRLVGRRHVVLEGCRCGFRWRPASHMPRPASRLTLEIVSVRVERVEDISEEDAVAEGIRPFIGGPWGTYYAVAAEDEPHATAQAAFLGLWRTMYGS